MRAVVAWLVVAGLLALSAAPAAAQATAGQTVQAPITRIGRPTSVNFLLWHRADRQYVQELYRQVALGHEQAGPVLYTEWRELQAILADVLAQGFDTVGDLPVRLYSPHATAVAETLALALSAREQMLAHLLRLQLRQGSERRLAAYEALYPPLGEGGAGSLLPSPGQPVTADQWPDATAVAQAFADLAGAGIPPAALAGSVYLSPFQLTGEPDGGALQDSGGPLGLVVGAMGRQPNHPYGTVLHLVGHHILARYFGLSPQDNEKGWQAYLSLRGDRTGPRRFDDGPDWALSSPENWVEDFRLAYGVGQLRHRHQGVYGQPGAAVLAEFKALVDGYLHPAAVSGSFTSLEWRDGLARPLATGAPGGGLVTPARTVTLAGQVASGGVAPLLWVSARSGDADRWQLVGGGLTPDGDGHFAIPLYLGPGEYEVLIEATSATAYAEARARLVLITGKLAGPAARPEFADLQGHWAAPQVERLLALGAIAGYPDGTFRPDEDITRGAFLKVMISTLRAEGLITGGFALIDPPLFEDMANHWARPYVDEAFRQGYFSTNEYGNRFRPDEATSRAEIARFAGAALDRHDFDPDAARHVERFSDADALAAWRKPAAGQAIKHGILTGYPDGSFGPGRHATRAEAAVIVLRLADGMRELRDGAQGSVWLPTAAGT